MCYFCESTQTEKNTFYKWAYADPYEDNEPVDYEGIDTLLDGNKFVIACAFESGYVGDMTNLIFKYCPLCGRQL